MEEKNQCFVTRRTQFLMGRVAARLCRDGEVVVSIWQVGFVGGAPVGAGMGSPAQVTPKTKTALANLLNTRLQGGAREPGAEPLANVRLPNPSVDDQHLRVSAALQGIHPMAPDGLPLHSFLPLVARSALEQVAMRSFEKSLPVMACPCLPA